MYFWFVQFEGTSPQLDSMDNILIQQIKTGMIGKIPMIQLEG